MNQDIPFLQRGDLIRIVSPAKAIDTDLLLNAQNELEKRGYRVKIGQHAGGRWNYFSGTDEERMADMQEALDDIECKAILCARGGYGSVRIVDRLNWAGFLRDSKWMIGFSDITVFHHRVQRFGLPSVHATMPLNFKENTPEALDSIFTAIEGEINHYRFQTDNSSKKGSAEGDVVGGNLSIVYSLLGTDDRISYDGAILFIEDLSEQLYAFDRMWHSIEKAGILDQISGLVIGGMTGFKDTDPPTGFSIESIILDKMSYRNIPVCFGFPAGHINDNRAIVLGKKARLVVEKGGCEFIQ